MQEPHNSSTEDVDTASALDEAVREKVRTAYRALTENVPGFRKRRAQQVMVAEIAKTLGGEYGGRRIIAVEGKTGTGKSIGYMLGAIPLAIAARKHLVISTATVALQEQIVNKDLPAFQLHAGLEFRYELAKGRRRYACVRNLYQVVGEQPQEGLDFGGDDPAFAVWKRKPRSRELSLLKSLVERLDGKQWDGDLDNLDEVLADDLISMVTTSSNGCPGSQCSWFARCPFYLARRRLQDATVIVANHDLLLASLALGSGAIIPETADCFFVLDEAHHLASRAISHFGAECHLNAAGEWLKKIPRMADEVIRLLPGDPALNVLSRDIKESVTVVGTDLHSAVGITGELWAVNMSGRAASNGDPERRWRFPKGQVPADYAERVEGWADRAGRLAGQLGKLRRHVEKALREEHLPQAAGEQLLPRVGLFEDRVGAVAEVWGMWGRRDHPDHPPHARWVLREGGDGHEDFRISASPVSAAGLLNGVLWDEAAGIVLTSATLTSLGSFTRLRMQLGLREDDGTRYLSLPSPFDYPQLAVLRVPSMQSSPKQAEEHTAELIELLPGMIGGEPGGTLVLFASARQMEQVAAGVRDSVAGQLLVQRELPKQSILEHHRRKVGQGEASTIFGLASFAEGVDLPGELCRHVIIAKLPFAVPDGPIDATYAEWLEEQGRNPFMEISLPDAALRLIQACGRLIRSEEDRGVVTLLDRRVVDARYGRRLLDSLPPFRREIG